MFLVYYGNDIVHISQCIYHYHIVFNLSTYLFSAENLKKIFAHGFTVLPLMHIIELLLFTSTYYFLSCSPCRNYCALELVHRTLHEYCVCEYTYTFN